MLTRTSLPKKIEREVLLEAGHRCAIPTCRQTPVEIAHIIPWAKVKEHTFDNLISLCPTCHTRYDKHEIDRQSMLKYKSNLSIINQRYGDFEKRVLEQFAENEGTDEIWIPGGLDIMIMYLIRDGYLLFSGQNSGILMNGIPSASLYKLTTNGKSFIQKWLN